MGVHQLRLAITLHSEVLSFGMDGKKKSTVLRPTTRKAPAIQTQVVARRMAGQPNSKIAKDLGMGVNTVKSIINLTDVDRMMQDGRIGAMERVPQALKTLDVRLEKNSESAAIWLLDKCFENEKPNGKRMSGDVTLNQTLQVLLRSEDKPIIEVKAEQEPAKTE
jgi:hypothetical protein